MAWSVPSPQMERAVGCMNVPPSNLQQLCDAIASAWSNSPVELFRHVVEFGMFCRQRGVRPSTRYVYLINCPVSFLFSRFPQQTFKNEVPGSFPTFVRSQINCEGFVGQSKKGPRKQKTEKIVLNFPVGRLYSFPVFECFLSLAG